MEITPLMQGLGIAAICAGAVWLAWSKLQQQAEVKRQREAVKVANMGTIERTVYGLASPKVGLLLLAMAVIGIAMVSGARALTVANTKAVTVSEADLRRAELTKMYQDMRFGACERALEDAPGKGQGNAMPNECIGVFEDPYKGVTTASPKPAEPPLDAAGKAILESAKSLGATAANTATDLFLDAQYGKEATNGQG